MRGYRANFGPLFLRGKTLAEILIDIERCSPKERVRLCVASMVWWDLCEVPHHAEDPLMPTLHDMARQYQPPEYDQYDPWEVLAAAMNMGYSFQAMHTRTQMLPRYTRAYAGHKSLVGFKAGIPDRPAYPTTSEMYDLVLRGWRCFWAGKRIDNGESRNLDKWKWNQ